MVGRSKSGKTSVTEYIIGSLVSRGFRVGAIKHTDKDIELDCAGKDSFRLRKAGASVVALSSSKRITLFQELDSGLPPEEIAGKFMSDVDLVITEGHKNSSALKIEITGNSDTEEPLFMTDNRIIAVISDRDISTVSIPLFRFRDIERVTEFIIKKVKLIQPHRVKKSG
jgi:molybdopterin-guanine dinucleotide biosynthesis protein B